MKGAVLILALFVACISCYSEQEYQSTFTSWMHVQKKTYTSDEFQTRYATFKGNMDYVQQWNSAGSPTVLGLTSMADMSNEEYRGIYLGFLGDKAAQRTRKVQHLGGVSSVGDLPASLNWADKGAVTGIKNQGQCGDCWAFSTTGSVEGAHFLAGNSLVSLSEQNLCDCSDSEGNQGCNGGLMDDAFEYIIKNKGVDTEASYPYKGVDGACKFSADNVGATITGYEDVTSGSESALQNAVANAPVAVAIDASHSSFQLYTSGVYYEPACSTTKLDHGVLAVGWGTDSGSDYWVVKNSWGTSWGQSGYIWMTRNKNNNCGIATQASYPTISGSSDSTTKSSTHSTTHVATTHTANNNNNNNGNSNNGNGNGSSTSTYSAGLELFQSGKGGKGYKPTKNAEEFNF